MWTSLGTSWRENGAPVDPSGSQICKSSISYGTEGASASRIASALLQQTESETRSTMTRMLTEGLIEERGTGRGRRYHLSAAVYRALDSRAAYVRVRSFEPIQQELMVLSFVRAHASINRSEGSGLCSMTPVQASNLLRRLAREGTLRMEGTRRGSRYVLP